MAFLDASASAVKLKPVNEAACGSQKEAAAHGEPQALDFASALPRRQGPARCSDERTRVFEKERLSVGIPEELKRLVRG